MNRKPTLHDCDYSSGVYERRLLEWLLAEQEAGRIPIPRVAVEVKQS